MQQSFGSILLSNTSNGQSIGAIDTGVETRRGARTWPRAPLEPTGQPLDLPSMGSGFFAVKTAGGVQYTRNGQFNVNAQGVLVDQFGDEVLSQSGNPIKVGAQGTVPATALGLFNLNNPSQLGNNNFSGQPTGRGTGQVMRASSRDRASTRSRP